MSQKKHFISSGPSQSELKAIADLKKMLARRKARGVLVSVSVYGVLSSSMRIVGIEENFYRARELAFSLGALASVVLLRSAETVATVGNEKNKGVKKC